MKIIFDKINKRDPIVMLNNLLTFLLFIALISIVFQIIVIFLGRI